MPISEKSRGQQEAALQLANYIRTHRMKLKRDVKAGKIEVIDLLLEPPQEIQKMRIMDLLVATPMLGPIRVKQLLKGCYISPMTAIGDLTERQRTELIRLLKRR